MGNAEYMGTVVLELVIIPQHEGIHLFRSPGCGFCPPPASVSWPRGSRVVGHAVAHPVVAHPVAHAVAHPVVAHAVAPRVVAHPVVAHPVAHAVASYNPGDLAEPSPYNYQYAVADDYSGANFAQSEANDGTGAVSGSYSVNLPDGRIQHVNYEANDITGNVATVTYEGTASYPDIVGAAHPVVGHAVAHPALGHAIAHPVAHAVARPVAVAHPVAHAITPVVSHAVAHPHVIG